MNKIKIYILSILHLLVDGLCAYTVVNKLYLNDNYLVVTLVFVLYNTLAFCFQPLIGLLIDKYKKEKMFLNISLIVLVLASTINTHWLIIVIFLGLANSIFHVVGGIYVVNYNEEKMTFLGLFVSLGAIGIALGTNLSNKLTLIIMLILAFILTIIINIIKFDQILKKEKEPLNKKHIKYICLILIVVLIRAIMGSACKPLVDTTLIDVISISIGVALGKILGGILSDKFGIKYVTIFTLMLSLIGYFFFRNNIVIYIISTILFNTTMPITLYLSNKCLKNRYGLSFGLLAFELGMLLILRKKDYKIYLLSLIMNIVTNLSLNYYLENTIFKTFLIYIVVVGILEITVLFVETFIYMIYYKKIKESFITSLLLNSTSFILGLIIYAII